MRVVIQDRDAVRLGEIDLDPVPLAGDSIQILSGNKTVHYDVLSRRFLVGPSRGSGTTPRDVELVVLVRQACVAGSKGYDWGAECPGDQAARMT
ncbi:hypothetical protein GIY56_14880 [Paracoccus sp. YIM 132242]|uniref:Uncharacterized protein n=1 Tax=Paracoccus lichenicola TaxID=2665644 RepID=A0A6L6HTE4_9RHOB|nr:hypothetical protein [Paracoccus lichenicola]MTE01570.1 hypothetical protein [Paracoccus lichenicola]